MADYELIGLNEAAPDLRAPATGDVGVVKNLKITEGAPTVNGVAYVDPSGALTNGAGLQFDGTKLITPNSILVSNSQTFFGDNGYIETGTPDGNSLIKYFGGKSLIFREGATEAMRLTSTHLLNGTSSTALFDGTEGFGVERAIGPAFLLSQTGATPGAYLQYIKGDGSFSLYNSLTNLELYNVSASGNLGLGVTPSANLAGSTLEINRTGNGISNFSNTDTRITQNVTNNGSQYARSGELAAQYQLNNGVHKWYTAPSGTAGDAITFTEKARIDSDGLKFNGDTAAANALDDYETGTWTPTVAGAGTAGTYTLTGSGFTYTKIGRLVTIRARFGFSAASGGTGYALIGNLPFAYKANAGIAGSVAAIALDTTAATSNGLVIENADSASNTALYMNLNIDNAIQEEVQIGAISTSTVLTFNLTYETA
jgi:hypothetical protein